jgi:protein-disulfide isomerase
MRALPAVALLVLAACGASPASRGGPGPWAERDELRIPAPVDDAPGRGAAEPLVTLLVFTDFECPYCRSSASVLDRVLADHGADVRLHVRHFPLSFHEHAALAAEAAEEARAQGGDDAFFRYHDRLMQGGVRMNDLIAHAEALGLDAMRFRIALRGRVHRADVERDLEHGDRLGVEGTPTLFVNGRPVLGVPPYPELDALIREELALAREALARGIPRAGLYERILADTRRAPAVRPRPERAPPEQEPEPLDLPDDQRASIAVPPDAPRRGAERPALVVQVFSDFQCAFCGRVQPTLTRLLESFPDVQLVFRHFPLPHHADAVPAALAAIEVHRQLGDAAFWAFHDLLFARPRERSRSDLVRMASEVGADGERVGGAIDTGRHQRIVDADVAAITRAGLRIGTPAFLIGERVLLGAQPYEAFERAVREELATAAREPGERR